MSVKTATVIGATGLIGGYLVNQLQRDAAYDTVRLLVRRPLSITNHKTEVKLIDFSDTESFKLGIDGSDVVFCTVGTTQKKVKGDKEAYRRVDFDIPVKAARFCKETQCFNFILVSAVGANPRSSNFYLRLKGEMEEAVKAVNIPSVSVMRPSMLLGARKEVRPAERLGQRLMKFATFAMNGSWQKYKPIEAADVAAAMIQAAKNGLFGFTVYEFEQMMELLKKGAVSTTK